LPKTKVCLHFYRRQYGSNFNLGDVLIGPKVPNSAK